VDVCDFGNVAGIAVFAPHGTFGVLGIEWGCCTSDVQVCPVVLALNVGCIAAIIAGAWLVAWKIGRLSRSVASNGSGNTAKRDKGL